MRSVPATAPVGRSPSISTGRWRPRAPCCAGRSWSFGPCGLSIIEHTW